ncbi:Tll0287-like domain-containing protein [Desulfobacterota bacterium M19]
MNLKQTAIIIIMSLCLGATAQASEHWRRNIAHQAVKELGTNLKKALKQAMKEGGPARAIAVCNEKALRIADKISLERGWRIGRTSLKYRNPANAPDAWERSVLLQFARRRAAGENPAGMEFSEIVNKNGRQEFRYMKAIPTAAICLKCHGRHIAPAIEKEIHKLYPDDLATGFKLGDIRGAFTITEPISTP